MLDQLEEVSSPHWMSSKMQRRGSCVAFASRSFRNAQAISSGVAVASPSPSRALSAVHAVGLYEGARVRDLLDEFHDRPVGDPLAVGKTAATHDRRAGDRAQELGDKP